MDNPGKIMGDQMAESNEILTLRATVKRGQELLRLAIEQRNAARIDHRLALDDLRAIRNHWTFFFLPNWLRAEIVWQLSQ